MRGDSRLALLVGQSDTAGSKRVRTGGRGYPLAGSSTLNRLEPSPAEQAAADCYKRIAADPDAMDRLLVEAFLDSRQKPPEAIYLGLDATDAPLHGHREERFFHGYYRQ